MTVTHVGTGERIAQAAVEGVNLERVEYAVARCAADLPDVDPSRVARKTIGGLHEGASPAEAARLAVQSAVELIGEEPQYSKLAARLLSAEIVTEVAGHAVTTFSESIALGHAEGLIGDETFAFVKEHGEAFDAAIDADGDLRFEYFGLRTVYDRYLLRHPVARDVIETPQFFLLRVACGLSQTVEEAVGFYRLMSSLAYLPSSPTLFNSGTRHTQMSSCYLVDSPRDELDSIYARYHQVARLSKFAGGIGIAFSRVRSRGALIRSTNGKSNGIVPFLRTLDSSVAAVNQGGRRKGAACVYLEPWHPDIEEFLQLRDNTGEDARRTHNLNLANWIPDEFMRRVEADGQWSLIDPDQVPELPDLWGDAFEAAYRKAEADGRFVRQTERYDRLWLRLLDVPAALAGRDYLSAGRVVLEVVDPGGYAAGRFALDASPDGADCRPTTESADLTVPVTALGSAYLGGHRLGTLAAAGLVDVHTPGALGTADRLLGTDRAPWSTVHF